MTQQSRPVILDVAVIGREAIIKNTLINCLSTLAKQLEATTDVRFYDDESDSPFEVQATLSDTRFDIALITFDLTDRIDTESLNTWLWSATSKAATVMLCSFARRPMRRDEDCIRELQHNASNWAKAINVRDVPVFHIDALRGAIASRPKESALAESCKDVLVALCEAGIEQLHEAGNQTQESSHQFEASVLWLGDEVGFIGRHYALEQSGHKTVATITNIKYRIDPQSLAHESCRSLQRGQIVVCNISTELPVTILGRKESKGCFVLREHAAGGDAAGDQVIAVGVARHALRRAENLHFQSLTISRENREKLNGHRGIVIWFTGLSGSGKSTLANALEIELHTQGWRTYILDGDNVRQGLNRDLGFSDADRVENIRRIAEVAKLMVDAGLIVMTSFISPFIKDRELARELIGENHFIEIHVSTALDVCEQRDPKGLYKKARRGEIPNMTGIGSAYEAPEHANLTIDTSKCDLNHAVRKLMNLFI